MTWPVVFFIASAIGWAIAFFGYLRPKFLVFRHVMGIQPLLEMSEHHSLWERIELRLRGFKGTILAFVTWLVTSLSALFDAVDPSVLAPVKDAAIWQTLGGENFALRIVSLLTIAIALLSIRGQIRAARKMPNPPPPPALEA